MTDGVFAHSCFAHTIYFKCVLYLQLVKKSINVVLTMAIKG